jgi:hypothetical protein
VKPFTVENIKRFKLEDAPRLSKTLKKALGLRKNKEYHFEIIVSEIIVSEKPSGSGWGESVMKD